MFCYQCEQTKGGTGCTEVGVCGKDARTAAMQDLLLYAVKDISRFAHRASQIGAKDRATDRFVIDALFATVTNVDFDPLRLQELVRQAAAVRQRAVALYVGAARRSGRKVEELEEKTSWWTKVNDPVALAGIAEALRITKRTETLGPDVTGLQELITYGLKGSAAYVDHASILGREDEEVYGFFLETLDYLTRRPTDVNELVGKVLKVGEVNLKVMGMLDAANTGAYGTRRRRRSASRR